MRRRHSQGGGEKDREEEKQTVSGRYSQGAGDVDRKEEMQRGRRRDTQEKG